MDKSVAQLLSEVTRQASFGTSGLVTRAQLRRVGNGLSDQIAKKVVPPEPVLTPYQQAEYEKMCQKNEEWVIKCRQLDIDWYRDDRDNGRNLRTTAAEINQKWLEELKKKNIFSKKICSSLEAPKKPVNLHLCGFQGCFKLLSLMLTGILTGMFDFWT